MERSFAMTALALVTCVAGCGGATPSPAPPASGAASPGTTESSAEPAAVVPKTAEGGSPLDASAVPAGKGWSCFPGSGGQICERTEAACNEHRSAVAPDEKCAPLAPAYCYTSDLGMFCEATAEACLSKRDGMKSYAEQGNVAAKFSGCAPLE